MTCNTGCKALDLKEQIGNIYGETKYSTSLFYKGKKLNNSDTVADNQIGFTNQSESEENDQYILCLKGGENAPKIFNRFRQVDAPERQLTYIADDENHDAISFIPNKDIKFAGFSVYHVASNTEADFKCLYRIKIGADSYPEKEQEFSQSEVDNKMVDIMMNNEIVVQKDKEISIAVRFI